MSSNISANALFHFTKKENLINILKDGFHVSYSLNGKPDLTWKEDWAIPMVSFCDIPLSQVAMHIKDYGRYAIGLYKEWGVKKGITPVFYHYPQSIPAISLMISWLKLNEQKNSDIGFEIANIYFYTKFYEGFFFRDGEYKEKRFYDEREWRYSPDAKELFDKNIRSLYKFAEFTNNQHKESQKGIKSFNKLDFSPNDIKYIIVNNDNEIIELCKELQNTHGQRYSYDEILKLTSRIITINQILEDF